MGRSFLQALHRHWRMLAIVGAAIAVLAAGCGSAVSGSGPTATSSSGGSSASQASPPATRTSASPSSADARTAGPSTVNVKIESEVAGTKAICAALAMNRELPELVGTNPSKLLYASGTVTNNVLGLNNVPGCQVGVDPTATNVTVAWALCNFPDPTSFTEGPALGGTKNVYNFAGTANGVIIVLGPKTLLAMLTGTAGSRSTKTLVTAMQDAATIWSANGGCASS